MHYYTNSTTCAPQKLQSSNGVFCFGNTVWDRPLRKVADGRPKFESMIERLNNCDQKEVLIEELLELVKSPVKYGICNTFDLYVYVLCNFIIGPMMYIFCFVDTNRIRF